MKARDNAGQHVCVCRGGIPALRRAKWCRGLRECVRASTVAGASAQVMMTRLQRVWTSGSVPAMASRLRLKGRLGRNGDHKAEKQELGLVQGQGSSDAMPWRCGIHLESCDPVWLVQSGVLAGAERRLCHGECGWASAAS